MYARSRTTVKLSSQDESVAVMAKIICTNLIPTFKNVVCKRLGMGLGISCHSKVPQYNNNIIITAQYLDKHVETDTNYYSVQ